MPLESAAPPPALADAEDQPADEDGQVPWRSPFPRPGPGRTVSSGAPSPRPEPLVPRTAAAQPPAETDAGTVPVLGRSPARPAPGTTEWERERVDRLARTFRETLRALEESLAGPQAAASPAPAATEPERPAAAPAAPPSAGPGQPVSAPPRRRRLDEVLQSLETRMPPATPAPAASAAPAPGALLANATADLVAPPAGATGAAEEVDAAAVSPEPAGTIIAAAPPAEAPPFERSTLPDQERVVIPTPAFEIPAGMLDEAPARSLETRPEAAAARVEVIPNTPAIVAVSPVEPAPTAEARLAPVAAPPVAPSPRLPVPTAAPPDVRRNIEEAALMRQRLPQHIDMLLRIPTNEVAQNSYKSPFRETREELIRRLLDPQLTLEEAARVLGVCPTTVRRYTNRGMLHCHRTPGNQRRFRMSDVLQFVEQYGDRIDRAAEARAFEEAA